jgi:tRNA(Ile)-lysidine synthase TilS/MesJ
MMERAAVAVAGALNLPIEVTTVAVPEGPSPEGQARMVRYAAFATATTSEDRLLTGHTRDDNVETVLFNLIRGTGPSGLAGIPYHRPPNIFRPMLEVTRSETREISSLVGLPFADDPMNEDIEVTRNVLRSRLIPELSELNPRLPDSIARMAASIASDNSYLDKVATEVGVIHGEGSVAVAVGDVLSIAKPLADRVLKSMLSRTVGTDSVTAESIRKLWSVAKGETKSQQLGSQFVVTRRGPMLVIETSNDRSRSQAIRLSPGRHRVGGRTFEVLNRDEVCKVVPLSPWVGLFAPGTELEVTSSGSVLADGELAWVPGEKRMPVAWYQPGTVGYLSVFAREESGWTSNP